LIKKRKEGGGVKKHAARPPPLLLKTFYFLQLVRGEFPPREPNYPPHEITKQHITSALRVKESTSMSLIIPVPILKGNKRSINKLKAGLRDDFR
jgi:hypothetical protein